MPGTGLSRYWDFGEGPAAEVLGDEKDAQGRTHYDRIREYYREHPDAAKGDYDLDRAPGCQDYRTGHEQTYNKSLIMFPPSAFMRTGH